MNCIMSPPTPHLDYVHKYVWLATDFKLYRSISNDVLTITLILYHETASLYTAYGVLDTMIYCAKSHRDLCYAMIYKGYCTHICLLSFNWMTHSAHHMIQLIHAAQLLTSQTLNRHSVHTMYDLKLFRKGYKLYKLSDNQQLAAPHHTDPHDGSPICCFSSNYWCSCTGYCGSFLVVQWLGHGVHHPPRT
jgi:hypothetical protein